MKQRYLGLAATFLFAVCAALCAGQTTPHLNLNTPIPGTPSWGPSLNTNFSIIDTWSATVCPKSACTMTGPFVAPNVQVTSLPALQCVQTGAGGALSTTGAPCPTGAAAIFGQASGVIPLATGVGVIGAQSHLDDGATTAGTITVKEPLAGTSASFSSTFTADTVLSTKDCSLSSTVASCVNSAASVNHSALIPYGTTGAFAQYPWQTATADCVPDATTGALTIFPTIPGHGYSTPPTVTWVLGKPYPTAGGSLGTITANLTGDSVTSYTVSGANSGWNTASQYHTLCPVWITVAPPPAPANATVAVVNQNKGPNTFRSCINVDDFGATGDGSTDDTLPINNAMQYASSKNLNCTTFTNGKTYYLGSVAGYFNGGGDDGTVPIAATLAVTASGGVMNGCTVTIPGTLLKTTTITNLGGGSGGAVTPVLNTTSHTITSCIASGGSGYADSFNVYAGPVCSGAPCATLPPETIAKIGISVAVPSKMTVVGNNATIKGGFSGSAITSATYGTGWPYVAAFGAPTFPATTNGWNISNLNFTNTFITFGNPGASNTITSVETENCGIEILAINSQFTTTTGLNSQTCMAGIVMGGQYLYRAPLTNALVAGGNPVNNEMDNTTIINDNYHGFTFANVTAWIQGRKALDCWYDVYMFHAFDQGIINGDNCPSLYGVSTSTRMPDQDIAGMFEPDSMWRGITNIAIALYSRYGYATNNVKIDTLVHKAAANYAVVAGPDNGMILRNLNTEANSCNGQNTPPYFGDPTCLNPYEPYNPRLPGSVLVPTSDAFAGELYENLNPLTGPSTGTLVHPLYDMSNTQNSGKNPIVDNLHNSYGASFEWTNPINQGGLAHGWMGPQTRDYQGTTQIGSDSYGQIIVGGKYRATGTNFQNSFWFIREESRYAPAATWAPILRLSHRFSSADEGTVMMPGLKVNGTLGIQGGQITSFTITNAGSGYTPGYVGCSVDASTLFIRPALTTAYKSDCAAYAGIAGTVTSVWCTICGQGYLTASPPSVTINAPTSGVTATATAVVAGIDADNPITHLTTCNFTLNAGGTLTAAGTSSSITTLSGITCSGVQYGGGSVQGTDDIEILHWGQSGGFPAGLTVQAWATAANTISVRMINSTNASIAYPAGSGTTVTWLARLHNANDVLWGVQTTASTPTVSQTTYTLATLPVKVSASITPAAATVSSCVEQTFNTFTGLATGQGVTVSAPASLGAHVWTNGAPRVSATNTLAITFCADAVGGTPVSGTYVAIAF